MFKTLLKQNILRLRKSL